MIIDETVLLEEIGKAKRVALIEPPHNRKYLPLGLAKISRLAKMNGSEVRFGRFFDGDPADLICVSSLFTYDMGHLLQCLHHIKSYEPMAKVIVGGIAATLNMSQIEEEMNLYKKVPVMLYPGYSAELDRVIPDYDMNWDVKAGWENFSYVFTSRGCPNKCGYCVVPKIEPVRQEYDDWYTHVMDDKPFIMISDNNLSACSEGHYLDVLERLDYARCYKSVIFDNGFDGKYINSNVARRLGNISYIAGGLRTAFDRIQEDGVFQEAMGCLWDGGVTAGSIMAYILFNFQDYPQDAEYRAEECLKLGVKPYPQRFVPLNWQSREGKYVGIHWTEPLAKSFSYYYNTGRRFGENFRQYLTRHAPVQWGVTQRDMIIYEQSC